jgi:hypothetical protein
MNAKEIKYGKCPYPASIRLARNTGVPPHVIREIEKLAFEHQKILKEKYHEYHKH